MFNSKKMLRDIIALCVICATLLLSFSCADSAGAGTDTTASVSITSGETAAVETADPDYVSDLPAKSDLGGFDFYILARVSNNDHTYVESWTSHDMDCEEQTGELIDDAVFERNISIEEAYNCSIHASYSANVGSDLKKIISAGDNTYSISTPSTADAATLATSGGLYNLYNIPNLNLSKKYWDQGLAAGLTISGKLYFATGDIMIMDNDATWVLYFNKSLVTDYNLTSPYDYVRGDTWTMETFYNMTSEVSDDIDGDGAFTKADRYGLVSHNGGFSNFQYFGNQPVISLIDGTYEITYNNDSMYKLVEMTNKIVNNKTSTFNIADWKDGVTIFSESRGLFYLEVLDKFRHLRGADIDFGVVPAPKLDENQEYYTTVIDGITSLVVIPTTNANPDETGLILEAMAADSVNTLTVAYYDKNLTGKFMRDDDSAEMLDIILAHRIYDVAKFYSIGTTTALFGNLITKNSNDFASGYTKLESAAVKALDKLLSTLETLP
jgi:hypothetical protein